MIKDYDYDDEIIQFRNTRLIQEIIIESENKMLLLILILIISTVIFSKKAIARQPEISFQTFYDELAPFGQWVNHPNKRYVWVPGLKSDFFPYSSDGHWIITSRGFTWLSDHKWGWAPFHYGRWDYNENYGWFWIPGDVWGPAWVRWRIAKGYYGWAPIGPDNNLSTSYKRKFFKQNNHWVFVKTMNIFRSCLNHFFINLIDHESMIRNSRELEFDHSDSGRNSRYVFGPTSDDVQKATGLNVIPITIKSNKLPGQDMKDGQLYIFKPLVLKDNNRSVPLKITKLQDVIRSHSTDYSQEPL
jgi:hypothetical protein